ncbi:MAG: hypothetical protein HY917_03220 [Candidatus Diapherotrites archaeon]|nr:hypothetical protein [Candidatus Diapherotrites archaeon]
MPERIIFKKNKDRLQFFDRVRHAGSFGSWTNLARFLGVKRETLRLYRAGHFTLPLQLFDALLHFLSHTFRVYYSTVTFRRPASWGQVKGGKELIKRHPEIFEKGRMLSRKRPLKYSFDTSLPLNREVAEFVGAFIGDGFTARYGQKKHIFMTQFTGDSRYDSSYYPNFIIPFAKRQFHCLPRVRIKENVIRVTFYSKQLFGFLTERLGLPSGLKFDKVLIPEEIYATDSLCIACIRGIFDTDGCVFFDKRPAYRKPCLRIDLHMKNPPLLLQIQTRLREWGIRSFFLGNKHHIQITGPKAVKEFVEKVGFSNERHARKLRGSSSAAVLHN